MPSQTDCKIQDAGNELHIPHKLQLSSRATISSVQNEGSASKCSRYSPQAPLLFCTYLQSYCRMYSNTLVPENPTFQISFVVQTEERLLLHKYHNPKNTSCCIPWWARLSDITQIRSSLHPCQVHMSSTNGSSQFRMSLLEVRTVQYVCV